MPFYDYTCESCGKNFEINQKVNDMPIEHCPSCYQKSLKRLISSSSFSLKGGGWYQDGYSSSKKTASAE